MSSSTVTTVEIDAGVPVGISWRESRWRVLDTPTRLGLSEAVLYSPWITHPPEPWSGGGSLPAVTLTARSSCLTSRRSERAGSRCCVSSPDLAQNLPAGVRLVLLPPKSVRQRNAQPEWDVLLNGQRIGRIEQWRARGATSMFYRAKAFHPETGKVIELESATDLGERVERVLAARRDPSRYVHKASWE